ncbi:MAG: hypothetical protein QXQ66_08850, partial [Candidatus Hadarchaeum sp.]
AWWRTSVRRRFGKFLKNKIKLWVQRHWCIPAIDEEFVARMEEILDLYELPLERRRFAWMKGPINFWRTSGLRSQWNRDSP